MNKTLKAVLLCLICFGALTSKVHAARTMVPELDQEGRKGDVARIAKQKALERFNALDKDGDGQLSKAEVEKDSRYLAEKFQERDLDHDDFLSWEEFVGHNRWAR